MRRPERVLMRGVESETARMKTSREPTGRRWAAAMRILPVLALLALAPAGVVAQQAGGERSAATQRLFDAVLDNDLAAVKAALAEGADTRARDIQERMPAGLAVDKGYFEIAHYILSARKKQRDKERQAMAPPPLPPALGDTQRTQAKDSESGWAVKKTEIAEQPGDEDVGPEIEQAESAERPGQRDAGFRAGRTEIAERAGDGAGAPKGAPVQAEDAESGWAVKKTEIAEQPGGGVGGTDTEQTAGAERPSQRDAGSRAGRTEIAERAGDGAGAPKAEPAEAAEIAEPAGDGTGAPEISLAEQADDDESGWKVKNVEISGEAGVRATGETARTRAPPPRSIETAETPQPLAAAELEPPESRLAGTPRGLRPPPRALGDSGTTPEAPAPSLPAPQETARAEAPAASASDAVTDAGPDEPLGFSSLLRSFGKLIGALKPRPSRRQAVALREPTGRATATGTAGAPEPVPSAPESAATSEEVATAGAPDEAASAPGVLARDGDAGSSIATTVPADPSLPGRTPTDQPTAAPEPTLSASAPTATDGRITDGVDARQRGSSARRPRKGRRRRLLDSDDDSSRPHPSRPHSDGSTGGGARTDAIRLGTYRNSRRITDGVDARQRGSSARCPCKGRRRRLLDSDDDSSRPHPSQPHSDGSTGGGAGTDALRLATHRNSRKITDSVGARRRGSGAQRPRRGRHWPPLYGNGGPSQTLGPRSRTGARYRPWRRTLGKRRAKPNHGRRSRTSRTVGGLGADYRRRPTLVRRVGRARHRRPPHAKPDQFVPGRESRPCPARNRFRGGREQIGEDSAGTARGVARRKRAAIRENGGERAAGPSSSAPPTVAIRHG